jgi:ABC-type sugar transport system ATPase subunit
MIRLRNLCLSVGRFALRDVCLDVAPGEYLVLLGANGSGKTLLMSCICGLARVDKGRIEIDGQDVTHLEPRLRKVGFVPQDYGLFPHLTVSKNLTFALRAWGVSHEDALKQIAPLVDLLDLGKLMDRRPKTLSGGERQKAALVRALSLKPKVLLLDEPVTALDGPTRAEVLDQLRQLQRQIGVSTVHVCHNMEEAQAVADRAAVMVEGQMVQVGTLDEIARNPVNPQVARLIRPVTVLVRSDRLAHPDEAKN